MTLDLDGRYEVEGYGGIAFYALGFADPEWVEVVMVGDDRIHLVEFDALTPIGEDDYCSGCGQIGCGHG